MRSYILKRFLYMLLLLFLISVVSFVIIQLPPGDYLNTVKLNLERQGGQISQAELDALTKLYGLDQPLYMRYLKWVRGIFQGNFGVSFSYNRPVLDLVMERLPLTVLISLLTAIFVFVVSIPVGILSAVKQYSLSDYIVTTLGFIGLATPNFLLALALMYFFYTQFGFSPGGLFSPQYLTESWSLAKFFDLLKHLPIPLIVIGTAGTAGLIRVMRGCLLDELRKQYVITARSKGLRDRRLLVKYPVRVAINPVISTIGWILPAIVSGETITSIVMQLPTTGPLLYRALLSQDMYLAGSIILLLSFLTIVGTFVSDILLVVVDPRIRFGT